MANEKELEILDAGQELIQTRGYEGFSYRDIADRVGIKSATIHYYFPAKSGLAVSVADRYRDAFAAAVAAIDAEQGLSAIERLERYAELFSDTLRNDRVCLCAMLAGGAETVPPAAQAVAREFFVEQHAWVAGTASAGLIDGSVRHLPDVERWSTTFVAALEGAMLVARTLEDPDHLDRVVEQLLEDIAPPVGHGDNLEAIE